jgi:hypothetical protein
VITTTTVRRRFYLPHTLRKLENLTWSGRHPWKGEVKDPQFPQTLNDTSKVGKREDWINRKYMESVDKQPQAKTFKKGIDFIRTNYRQDNWFLHIETLDPHEPFF